jgi:carboxypeptidase Taq
MSQNENYQKLLSLQVNNALLQTSSSVLGWDQEVMMPKGGIGWRARQLGLLAGLVHERSTTQEIGDLLQASEDDHRLTSAPRSVEGTNLRMWRREYDKATKLPSSLVQEIAETRSLAQSAWKKAKDSDDFSTFHPFLEKNLNLAKREAECYGPPQGGELWDALADNYEPGANAKDLSEVFNPLRDRLAALIQEVQDQGTPPDNSFLEVPVPKSRQDKLGRLVLSAMGYDFNHGRLDESSHPFTTSFSPADVRVTTRYQEANFLDALGSTMHEGGHALYEQGLPMEHAGTPTSDSISLGIHESQSRLWENMVGHSQSFWKWCTPKVHDILGGGLRSYNAEAFFKGSNRVQPSLIRVEADETTYNLHIMIRFEIELMLFREELVPQDLPMVWNQLYKKLLGVDVPNDSQGCLQDVHWSLGCFGYFPTYTLGNLYAAQFFAKAEEDLGPQDETFSKGDFSPLLQWLREKIHSQGSRFYPGELCEQVTGYKLSPEPFFRYLENKIRETNGY